MLAPSHLASPFPLAVGRPLHAPMLLLLLHAWQMHDNGWNNVLCIPMASGAISVYPMLAALQPWSPCPHHFLVSTFRCDSGHVDALHPAGRLICLPLALLPDKELASYSFKWHVGCHWHSQLLVGHGLERIFWPMTFGSCLKML